MASKEEYGVKRSFVRGKLPAFFLCLIISGFLWLSHRLNQTYYYSINIPVRFTNLPSNKLLLNSLPDNLRFDIKTSGLKLFFVLLNKPFNEIAIDFNHLKSNNTQQAYTISSGNINLKSSINFDVDIKKISPDTLYFAARKGISKNVPVKTVLMVNAGKGFVLSKPIVNPAFVTITGDSMSLAGIDSISTSPLYLNELTSTYKGNLSLVKPSESVFLNLNEVELVLPTDKILQKEIEISVAAINVPANFIARLFPKKIKVNYSSSAEDFDEIKEHDFKAIVNYSKGKKEVNKLPVELSVQPTQARILSIEPSEVEYLIFKTK